MQDVSEALKALPWIYTRAKKRDEVNLTFDDVDKADSATLTLLDGLAAKGKVTKIAGKDYAHYMIVRQHDLFSVVQPVAEARLQTAVEDAKNWPWVFIKARHEMIIDIDQLTPTQKDMARSLFGANEAGTEGGPGYFRYTLHDPKHMHPVNANPLLYAACIGKATERRDTLIKELAENYTWRETGKRLRGIMNVMGFAVSPKPGSEISAHTKLPDLMQRAKAMDLIDDCRGSTVIVDDDLRSALAKQAKQVE